MNPKKILFIIALLTVSILLLTSGTAEKSYNEDFIGTWVNSEYDSGGGFLQK